MVWRGKSLRDVGRAAQRGELNHAVTNAMQGSNSKSFAGGWQLPSSRNGKVKKTAATGNQF
jgi:hypothetical protein